MNQKTKSETPPRHNRQGKQVRGVNELTVNIETVNIQTYPLIKTRAFPLNTT